jgi:hypothetical protein
MPAWPCRPPVVGGGIAILLFVMLRFGAAGQAAAPKSEPTLNDVLQRMSEYVAAYGEQAAMFVGTERYAQRVEGDDGVLYTQRQLTAEFAIVKTGRGGAVTAYRDVVKINGAIVVDRPDRLLSLLTAASADAGQLKQIADESARYNIGPFDLRFSLPTTALLFFDPATLGRFSFAHKATTSIDGVATWALEFKETGRPTRIQTREGRDVPCEGTLWVVPNSGTVIRTRLELHDFADQLARDLRSLAQVEVTYRLDRHFGVWLPLKMSELYEGAIPAFRLGSSSIGSLVQLGRATSVAEYADFKRFETSADVSK